MNFVETYAIIPKNGKWGVAMLAVSIIELVVMFASACFVVKQICLLKEQMKKQHEEKRRENTINYLFAWCNSVRKDTSIAEQVARKLSNEQGISLYKHESFCVSELIRADICKFCPLEKNQCAECSLKNSNKVDGKILTELRWHVINYLNTLETVLIAWDLGIVDRKTVEEQFAFLKDSSKGVTLSQFRNIAGGFPVIEKFIDKIKNHSDLPRDEL